MDFSALLIKMFIFVVLIFTGYGLARRGILSSEFTKGASALIIHVFVAASIINSVVGNRPNVSVKESLFALFMMTVMLVVTYLISFASTKIFFKGENSAQKEIMMSATNTLFVGLPILSAVCGSEAVFYTGLCSIPYNLILFSYGAWRLKAGVSKDKLKIKDLLSVCLVAAVISFVLFLLNPPIPKIITELFSTVSGGTVPLSMIVIGAALGKTRLVDAFKVKELYLISFIRLVVTPLAVFFITRLLTDNITIQITSVVLSGCPTATVVTPLSIKYGYSGEAASKIIMVTTLLSLVTIPLLLKVLFV